MTDRSAYEQKRQAQLRQLDAEIEKLKAKAAEVAADAKIGFDRSLDEALTHRDALRSRLVELSDAGEDAWEELKDGVDAAWEQLTSSFDDARAKLQA